MKQKIDSTVTILEPELFLKRIISGECCYLPCKEPKNTNNLPKIGDSLLIYNILDDKKKRECIVVLKDVFIVTFYRSYSPNGKDSISCSNKHNLVFLSNSLGFNNPIELFSHFDNSLLYYYQRRGSRIHDMGRSVLFLHWDLSSLFICEKKVKEIVT